MIQCLNRMCEYDVVVLMPNQINTGDGARTKLFDEHRTLQQKCPIHATKIIVKFLNYVCGKGDSKP